VYEGGVKFDKKFFDEPSYPETCNSPSLIITSLTVPPNWVAGPLNYQSGGMKMTDGKIESDR
jgi:hypothetical protein